MNLTQWLLDHYGQEQMKPGLQRIENALAPIQAQLKKCKIVTIAGTNGKGETTLWLSRYLKNRSHKAWISPHIERITERFRDEKGEIEYSELEKLVFECHHKVQQNGHELSYYEFLFFCFCHWVVLNPPEILLLEVGLGGRLDAVNAFDAELVLLPSISRDHQEFLGSRYDQILLEKLAILRKNSTLISYLSLEYLRERTREFVARAGGELVDLESLGLFSVYEFSFRNQLLACAAFLKLSDGPRIDLEQVESYRNWSKETSFLEHRGEVWDGRGNTSGTWVFFGSHNTDGLRKLIQFLHSGNYNFSRPPFDAVIIAFSRRSAEDLRIMLRMVKSSGLGKIIVTTFSHPKAASVELIESMASQEGLEFVRDIAPYLEEKKDQRLLVTGSYYFIGDFQSRFRS